MNFEAAVQARLVLAGDDYHLCFHIQAVENRERSGQIGGQVSSMDNIFSRLSENKGKERFDQVLQYGSVRIERIISKGHTSPDEGWYDQPENEWVLVLEGSGSILFEDGREVTLEKGDYLNIPCHARHRVSWTDPGQLTVWLAVFYT